MQRGKSTVTEAAKKVVKYTFRSIGLEIRRSRGRVSRHKPSPIFEDLRRAMYFEAGGEKAAFRCPLESCVWPNGLGFGKEGWNHISAVLDRFAQGLDRGYEGSVLKKYYEVWKPSNALDALLLQDMKGFLDNKPDYLLLLPWHSCSVGEKKRRVQRISSHESKRFGYPELGIEHGYKLHGPVDKRKGEMEYDRSVAIYESLQRKGYDRNHGDVRIWVLKRGSEYLYVNVGGMHRVAAMSALGYQHVPASFMCSKVIDVKDLSKWPQVAKGIWSKENAKKYIDHLFEFDSLEWANRNAIL